MKIVETHLNYSRPFSKRLTTTKIVIHHADASECDAKTIHQWHQDRGWSGMGYHYLVRKKNGVVETGRPINTIGAHCTGQNADSIGICFEGDFDKENMTNEQLATGRELIAYLRGIYGQNIRIVRHKDLMATDCPGKNFPFDELIKKEKKKSKKKTYSGKFPTLPTRGYFDKYDRGEQARLLQLLLNWITNDDIEVDGYIGEESLNCVGHAQKILGFKNKEVDCLWGAKTQKKAKSYKK